MDTVLAVVLVLLLAIGALFALWLWSKNAKKGGRGGVRHRDNDGGGGHGGGTHSREH